MTDADMIEAMARTLTDDIKTMEFVAEHDGDHDTVRETLRQAIACIRSLTAENEALRRNKRMGDAALDGAMSRAESSEALVAELRRQRPPCPLPRYSLSQGEGQ